MQRDAEKDLAMCEAATLGPWVCKENTHPELNGQPWGWIQASGWKIGTWSGSRNPNHVADNRFIAEAREALPYWIKRAMAAEAEVDQLRKEHHLDRIELNRRIMKLETENTRMVALAGAGYEKLVKALQTIVEEIDDLGARECAAEALKSIEVS